MKHAHFVVEREKKDGSVVQAAVEIGLTRTTLKAADQLRLAEILVPAKVNGFRKVISSKIVG